MALDRSTLDELAACLEYPEATTAARARRAADSLASFHPEVAAALWNLAVFLERAACGEAEERYTTLFDVNPVCTLHVGYHLFGESYARGELLAGLAGELRKADVSMNGDLPDFVPVLLRLLGRLALDDARMLREAALLPGLRKIAEALAASNDPWSRLACTLPEALTESDDVIEEPRLDSTAAALSLR